MKLFRARIVSICVVALALAALFLTYEASGQKGEKPTTVEATILVMRKVAPPNADDYLSTHLVILTSPLIAERAVTKGNLTKLGAFAEAKDPVGALLSGLSVTRDKAVANVITLSFRGASAEDGSKILSAVVDAYVEYLDRQNRNANDEKYEQQLKAREMLRQEIVNINERILGFARSSASTTKTDLGVAIERLQTLERKKTELVIRETEVRIALKQAEGSDARPGLQIDAHVWAAKVGFEKLPKAVQSLGVVAAYKEHLQEKRAQLVEFRAAVDAQINKANTHIREAAQLKRKEESLRAEAVNATKLFDATVKRLMEISLERDAVGFQVNVLSAPKGFKSSR